MWHCKQQQNLGAAIQPTDEFLTAKFTLFTGYASIQIPAVMITAKENRSCKEEEEEEWEIHEQANTQKCSPTVSTRADQWQQACATSIHTSIACRTTRIMRVFFVVGDGAAFDFIVRRCRRFGVGSTAICAALCT